MYLSKYNISLPLNSNISEEWKLILLNTLTGNVVFLNKEYIKFFDEIGKTSEFEANENKVIAFKERGFIYNNSQEEKEKESILIKSSLKYYRSMVPPQFIITLTQTCNLECVSCCYNQNHGYMSKEKMTNAVKFINTVMEENHRGHLPEIFIGGGEPLLDNQKAETSLEYILGEISEKKWSPLIITNGKTLTRYRTILKQFPNVGIRVQLSTNTDPLSFESLSIQGIDSIRNLHSNIFVDIYINNEEGLKKIPQFIESVYSWGWGYSTNIFFTLQSFGNISCPVLAPCYRNKDISFFTKFLNIFKTVPLSSRFTLSGISPLLQFSWLLYRREYIPPSLFYCRAHVGLFVLTPEGSVFPCLEATEEPSLSIGRFSPKIALNKSLLRKWRQRDVTNIAECSNCKFRFSCCGGCAMRSFREKNNLFAPACEPIAEIYQICFSTFYKDLLTWAPLI